MWHSFGAAPATSPRLSPGRVARPLAKLRCRRPQPLEAGSDPDKVCQDMVKAVLTSLSTLKEDEGIKAFHFDKLNWEVPLRQSNQSIIDYTQQLENVCANMHARRRATTLRFLMGCILVAGDKLPIALVDDSGDTLSSKFDRTDHRRMKRLAAFACRVVAALSMSGGERAYNIFHVFAGESTHYSAVSTLRALATTDWFRKARDLPNRSREDVANRLLAKLKASDVREYLHTSSGEVSETVNVRW